MICGLPPKNSPKSPKMCLTWSQKSLLHTGVKGSLVCSDFPEKSSKKNIKIYFPGKCNCLKNNKQVWIEIECHVYLTTDVPPSRRPGTNARNQINLILRVLRYLKLHFRNIRGLNFHASTVVSVIGKYYCRRTFQWDTPYLIFIM